MAGKLRIHEIELGRFGQPLACILEIRGQQGYGIGRLQYGQPGRYRVGTDTDLVGQFRGFE